MFNNNINRISKISSVPIQHKVYLLLCIYRALNHIDRNALWIDLNAEDIDRNAMLMRM